MKNTRISTATQTKAMMAAIVMLALSTAAVAQSSSPASNAGASGKVTNVSVPQGAAAASAPATAPASAAVTQTPAPTQATLNPPATNRVGDATSYLLALQASGQYASRNNYPVTSDVAQRTYQRYLESFTHKIPESSETQVGNKSGSGR